MSNGGYLGVGLAAAAVAASAMFFLDARSGRRRRALVRDQMHRAAHMTEEFVGKAGRDARQRARGLYSEQTTRFRREQADDRILAERVRAALGRLTSHPGPIYVSCKDGLVRLRGDVLRKEAAAVLRGVKRVRGVRELVDELRVHETPGKISSLQGAGAPRSSGRLEYWQANWSPAPRALAGAAGVALLAGAARRTSIGYAAAACGAALLARSILNRPLTHAIGVRASDADGVHVQKTIEVYAEVDEAYASWRDLERFPRFMSHVRRVEKLDDRRYRWSVDGPAGMPVTFDSEITADVPGKLIAWRTIDSQLARVSGAVRFEPTPYGGARIHVRMTYRPLANLVGHGVAKIFGRDPQHQLDADLQRFKTYIEKGAAPPLFASSRGAFAQGEMQSEPIQH